MYDSNARWYDPALGRFIQADALAPQPGNPLAWDRYAYAGNNQANYIDPTGHAFECGLTGGDHCGSGYGSYEPVQIVQAPDDATDNIWAITETALSIISDPADLALAGLHCLGGECDPAVIIGMLPLVPSSLVRLTGQFHHALSKKVLDALAEHKTLRGIFKRNDYIVQAKDLASHN